MLFFIYLCRCEDAEAFEVQDGRKSTGIFTKYLNMHILESEKVTHVLEKVSEGEFCKQGYPSTLEIPTSSKRWTDLVQ